MSTLSETYAVKRTRTPFEALFVAPQDQDDYTNLYKTASEYDKLYETSRHWSQAAHDNIAEAIWRTLDEPPVDISRKDNATSSIVDTLTSSQKRFLVDFVNVVELHAELLQIEDYLQRVPTHAKKLDERERTIKAFKESLQKLVALKNCIDQLQVDYDTAYTNAKALDAFLKQQAEETIRIAATRQASTGNENAKRAHDAKDGRETVHNEARETVEEEEEEVDENAEIIVAHTPRTSRRNVANNPAKNAKSSVSAREDKDEEQEEDEEEEEEVEQSLGRRKRKNARKTSNVIKKTRTAKKRTPVPRTPNPNRDMCNRCIERGVTCGRFGKYLGPVRACSQCKADHLKCTKEGMNTVWHWWYRGAPEDEEDEVKEPSSRRAPGGEEDEEKEPSSKEGSTNEEESINENEWNGEGDSNAEERPNGNEGAPAKIVLRIPGGTDRLTSAMDRIADAIQQQTDTLSTAVNRQTDIMTEFRIVLDDAVAAQHRRNYLDDATYEPSENASDDDDDLDAS
ncbi:hypothetical protein EXIGLDRAFT_784353, partial [Exidia glandulosa HHB12029]